MINNIQIQKSIILFFSLILLSLNCTAGNTAWKKSYQLEAQGKFKDAASQLIPLVQKNNEYALLRTAYLYYMQRDYGSSIEYYSQAIKLAPKSIDAKLGITLPLMAQQRWRQVKFYTLQVLKQSHWNYTAHLRLMMAEEAMGKWKTLESHAKQLSEVYPGDATSLVYLARAYAWQNNTAAASSTYTKVLQRIPAHIEAKSFLNKHRS